MRAILEGSDLTTPEGRERALDMLGTRFVDGLVAADGDRDAAYALLHELVEAFYDVRESADQLRCMYAGHFFLVDAVGLEDTDRPVPWEGLARRVDAARLELYREIFNAAERAAR